MNKEKILEFINVNPVFYLATSENNIPHVRAMTVYIANEKGIIFNTKKFKNSDKELKNNPHVEMCFYNPKDGIQIRIFGKVTFMEDLEIKKEIVKKFPILQPLVDKNGYDVIAPYCLNNWKAKLWTSKNIAEIKEIE